jgi:major membrane immunogen (membrane-anchored lipoprotein)
MRRIVLWVLSTLSALVLLFGYSTSTSGPLATGPQSSIESSPTISSSGTASGTSGGASGSRGGSAGSGAPGSSTVTGSVADTRWGPVQVQLTVAAGKVTVVSVVQYPNGNGKDQEINDHALPILTQETVDSQSADIDMVSGATVTSDGYIESLQSALDQAGL